MNRDVINQAWAAACVACPDLRDLLEAQPQWNESMQQETATVVNSILPTQTSTCPILPEKRCSTQYTTSAPSTSASLTWEMEQNSSCQPDTIPVAWHGAVDPATDGFGRFAAHVGLAFAVLSVVDWAGVRIVWTALSVSCCIDRFHWGCASRRSRKSGHATHAAAHAWLITSRFISYVETRVGM